MTTMTEDIKPVVLKSEIAKPIAKVEEIVRVVEDRCELPRTSPSARRVRKLLDRLVTLAGEAVAELGQAAKQALVIERDETDKRIIRVSLRLAAPSPEYVARADRLLNPERQKQKRRRIRDQKTGTLVEKEEKAPSPRTLSCPEHLRLNSYGLVEKIEQKSRPTQLVFRLLEEYLHTPNTPASGNDQGKSEAVRWELPATYLQMVLASWFPSSFLPLLPKEARQGVAQEVAQQIGSHIGLKESGSQPYTSFASTSERNPEKCRRAWRQAVTRLAARRAPFARRKYRGELVINDPDVAIFRRGPYPARMSVRWISSDSVIVRKWKDQLYAFLPVFGSLDKHSPLWRHYHDGLFWWRAFASEFETLPAWLGSKKADLADDEELVCLPLAHQPRLEEWLSDPARFVSWSLLTERPVNGRREYHLHIVTGKEVVTPWRPHLLAVLPTREHGYSCLRWALIENGQIGKSAVSLIDRIPLTPPRHDRSWQKARRQKAIATARVLADLADQLEANLAIGQIERVDKRHGDENTNTAASRWNYAVVLQAITDKALDRAPGPVAVVAYIREHAWKKAAGSEAAPEAQIRAVAKLGWERFQVRLKKQASAS